MALALENSVSTQAASTPDAGLVVRECADADRAAWDAFVQASPRATFFHRFGWRSLLQDSLGHPAYYLCVERGGRIAGVLPLGHVRSRLFGSSLVSVPFCVYGGVVADGEEARAALVARACGLAETLGVDYLELRGLDASNADWPRRDLYVTFRKSLDTDPEVNLKAVPRKQRAMIRKGQAAGLESAVDDDIDRFYRAYSESVRNLGTPVLAKSWFRTLAEEFGPDCEILTVTRNGELVSSVMSFYFGDQVLPYYGGGTAAARELKGNDFMYWELMRRACRRGIRVFDYGRSKVGSGSYRFKTHWGFEPQPLHYEVKLVRGVTLPEVNPTNPKYRLLIEGWKRLPLPVSRLIGPVIARQLG